MKNGIGILTLILGLLFFSSFDRRYSISSNEKPLTIETAVQDYIMHGRQIRQNYLPSGFRSGITPPPGDYKTKDTVINGWNAKVRYSPSRTDSSELVIYFPGAGEVGTDPSKLLLYSPFYYTDQLKIWDGSVELGNGTHYPIYIALQPTSQSVITGPNIKARMDIIFARWKIKKNARYFTGPSAGGFACWAYATYQASPGVFTGYGDNVTAIMAPEAVKPNQQQASTPAYPGNTTAWIQLGKYALAFNQINDPSRDIPTYYSAMNTAVPGHVTYYNTNFNGGGHGSFDYFWSPDRNDWVVADNPDSILALPIGGGVPKGWNTYQWLLRKGDTSLANVVSPFVTAGANQTQPTTTSSIVFTATATPGTGGSIVSYLWTQTSGSAAPLSGTTTSTLTITGPLTVGVRNFQILVTDNAGLQAVSTATLTSVDTSTKATIFAGRDTTLGLNQSGAWGDTTLRDTTQLLLKGSGTGSIISWHWRQISGPTTITFANASSPITNSYSYGEGRYVLELSGQTSSGVTVRDTALIRGHDWQTHNAQDLRPGGGVGWHLAKTGDSFFVYNNLDLITRDVNNDGILDHIQGGDTLYIPGGVYKGVAASGWHGKSGSRLLIRPEPGTIVKVSSNLGTYLRFGTGVNDSSALTFVDIDGTLDRANGIYYGFQHDNPVMDTAAVGVTFNATSDANILGVYIHNVGVGMFVKNNSDSNHALQCFDLFRFYNIRIFDFQLFQVLTEAFYLGHTQPDGKGLQGAQNDGPTVRLQNIEIFNITEDSIGYDGIQTSNAIHAYIHDNVCLHTGYRNAASQRSGTIMGGNLYGENAWNIGYMGREGWIGTPMGPNYIHDNMLIKFATGGAGALAANTMSYSGGGPNTTAQELFYNNQNDSATFVISNNIIDSPENYGIRVYNPNNFNKKIGSFITNNIIAHPTKTQDQLISTEFVPASAITGNKIIAGTLGVTIVNLSTKDIGPKIRVTYHSTTQDFTGSPAKPAIQFVRTQITGVSSCNCLTSPIKIIAK